MGRPVLVQNIVHPPMAWRLSGGQRVQRCKSVRLVMRYSHAGSAVVQRLSVSAAIHGNQTWHRRRRRSDPS